MTNTDYFFTGFATTIKGNEYETYVDTNLFGYVTYKSGHVKIRCKRRYDPLIHGYIYYGDIVDKKGYITPDLHECVLRVAKSISCAAFSKCDTQ